VKAWIIKLFLAAALTFLIFSLWKHIQLQRTASAPQSGEFSSPARDHESGRELNSLELALWASPSDSPARGYSRLDSLQSRISETRRNAIVRAAMRAAPAVVSVNVIQTQVVTAAYRDFFGYFYVPRQQQVQNLGSGFIINPRGYILTNEHVVHQASKVTISTSDGSTYDARIVGVDENTDLALLKIEPGDTRLPTVQLGDSDDLLIGEWAIAIGSPFGLLLEDTQPTVTVGVISAAGRDIKPEGDNPEKIYTNMIQTDAAINPGNSGGPLLNALGEVIGINTFIFSPSGGSVGMGFAIPINRAKRIAEDLIRGGKVRRPWIGIEVKDLTPELLESLGYRKDHSIKGVVISGVQFNSPAARNGSLRSGDIITQLDGRIVHSSTEWAGEMFDIRVDVPIELSVFRDGSGFQVKLIPVEQPTESLKHYSTGIGFDLVDLTQEVKSQLGVRVQNGAVVVNITDQDLEREGTILVYDILYRIGNVKISGAEQAVSLLKSVKRGMLVVLYLEREGRSIRRYLTG